MKLTLTVTEITTLARKSLGLPLDTEINIIPDQEPLPESILSLINTIDNLYWATSDKLQCIKKFRSVYVPVNSDVCVIGIFDAKLAIENWPFTRKWILEHKKLPTKFGGNQHNFTLDE